MPYARRLPDREVLVRLLRAGRSQADIADMYGVTRQAVSNALRGVQGVERRPNYRQYIPWRVKVEHTKALPIRMLRFYARLQTGGKLSPGDLAWLEGYLERLDRLGVIIAYDPDEPDGFYYVTVPEGTQPSDFGYVERPEVDWDEADE